MLTENPRGRLKPHAVAHLLVVVDFSADGNSEGSRVNVCCSGVLYCLGTLPEIENLKIASLIKGRVKSIKGYILSPLG